MEIPSPSALNFKNNITITKTSSPIITSSNSITSLPLSTNTSNTITKLTNPKKHPSSTTLHNKPLEVKKHNVSSYAARQAAIVEIQKSTDLVSSLSRLGGILKVQDLNVILRHLGNLNRWKDMSQLFEWMQEQRKTNISSYSSYIKFMGRNFNCVKALEIYRSIEDPTTKNNVSVCNSVLGCLIKNGKFETGMNLFYQMKQDGFTPDAFTYSTLLSGCIKIKDGYSKALELTQEMNDNGVHMDSVIYGTLIAVCASNKQSKVAEDYFKQMKNAGHCPNEYHYSSLLNAYSVDGDYMKANECFEDMKLAGLVPNKVMLTTLLKVYVRRGLFEKSRELLSELEAVGYATDEMPYCLLMDGLAKSGRINEAKSVFNEMKRKHVKSDGYAQSIMISAFCRGGLLEEAKQLAKDIETSHDKYDLVLLNTMICAYCRAGEMESVMLMLKKMDELSINPDYNTYHILIKYFCKEEVYMLAYKTMEDMYNKGYQPEELLCSSVIFNLGKTRAHLEAFSVYNMLSNGKQPIRKTYHENILHILIAGRHLKEAYIVVKDNSKLITRHAIKKFAKAFMKFGGINLINDVLTTLDGFGYKIDQELFEMAISRYIDQSEKELLIQMLQWMPGQGYVVDSSTRNILLKNSHLFGRQLIAEILSQQHTTSKTSKSHSLKDK